MSDPENPDFEALNCRDKYDLRGKVSESYNCVDCGFDTHPGAANRAETERRVRDQPNWKGAPLDSICFDCRCEVYMVRESVWKKTGLEAYGGCLCIGCLEKRIGRRLKPKDFLRGHVFNSLPGTSRLLQRRGG